MYWFSELILNGRQPVRDGDTVRIGGVKCKVVEAREPDGGRQMVRLHGRAPSDYVPLGRRDPAPV